MFFKKIKDMTYTFKNYEIKSIIFNAISILSCDYVIISFQKCGKTWLRVMISKVLQEKYNIKKIKLDLQRMTWFTKAPNILISHAGSIKDNNKIDFIKVFKNKNKIFLVRDPRDIVVSLFHGSRTRDKSYKGDNISKFIRDKRCGFIKIINFMNLWLKEIKRNPKKFTIIKYEDLKDNTKNEIKKLLKYVKIDANDELIDKVIQYGSFNNMRKMEKNQDINDYRMKSGNKNDPNSFRTRKGKVGGFNEELSAEDISYLNEIMKNQLDPYFNYII